jgi:hypothetical protein
MKIYKANIAQGIGDNIMAKYYADTALAQGEYDQIYYTHHAPIVELQKNNSQEYWKFLQELGQLFFPPPKFVYNVGQHPFRDATGLINDLQILPRKPQYKDLLCKGALLNLDQEYIVITTKLRYFDRPYFDTVSKELWNTLNKLATRYKIVVLGEREVERCQDYQFHGINKIYGIYDEIIKNIPADKLLDLTIPKLGITSPTLSQIQQDCLIMSEAKFVMMLGIGGNYCMAMAVANMISFRIDNYPIDNDIFSVPYPDAFMAKTWSEFIQKMESYL